MRDDHDRVTLELPGVTEKRGRGRPRKDDALTPAQRAQRYRDRKKRAALMARVQIKYRGPNGETWSGRGLMPRWITVLLERGHKLAELEVRPARNGP